MRRSVNRKPYLLLVALQLVCAPAIHAQDIYTYADTRQDVQQKSGARKKQPEVSQQQTLFEVLKDLNKTRGVYFLFSDQSLGNRLVNPVKNENSDVEKILKQVLENTGLKYKKVNDKTFVILTPRESVKSNYNPGPVIFNDTGDPRVDHVLEIVAGKVTDSTGAPLSGITVMIKGTRKGTTTTLSGIFSIEANKGDILVFSAVGFVTQEVAVGDQPTVNVSMKLITGQMTEVIVTALGIKKQERAVGYSTTEVAGSKFTLARESNLGNALTGLVAGVNVAGTATGPYGSSRVVIRGNSSLTGKNQPLYVIDGVPYDNTNQGGSSGQWGGADYGDGLSNINPDDVESIQVLKGIAASALYGYRGGNGAILITTKSGMRNKGIGVEVNNNLTANNVVDGREYQYEYGQGSQGVKPATQAAAFGVANNSWGAKMDGSQAVNFLGDNYAYSPAEDNFKNFYKTGVTNQSSIALTGGNERGHFRLGLSNLYMTTVVPNSDMKQQGVNFNSTYDVTNKLHMTLTVNYLFEKVKNRASFSDAPGNVIAGPLYLANSFDIRWLKPADKADGTELLPGDDIYFNNPYFVAYKYQNSTNRNRITGGLTLKYDLTDWLAIQGQVTRDGYNVDVTQVVPSGTGYASGGQYTQYTTDFHELNGNFMLEATKKFKDFSVHANVGGNTQDNVVKHAGLGAVPLTGQGPAGPFNVPFFYSASNISNKPFGYYYAHYRVNSLYGSADLGYKNFLFLTLTARNDWFSTLDINSNHYLYPSISGSFIFSDVLQLPDWISFGKLRASYAQSSGGTEPYRNLLTYGLLGSTINGQSIGNITQKNIPNSKLKPINIQEQEVGLNMQFLNNRLGIDVAVYNKKTTDDILNVTVSQTSGYEGTIANIGVLRNRGIELLLTGTPVKNHDFQWNVSLNIATNNNKVLDLGEGIKQIVIEGAYPRWGDGVSIQHMVGSPFAQIVGFAYKRDPSGKVIYDNQGFPERSDAPVALGTGVYKTTGGISNDFHYKNFVLAFLVDFKYGAKIYSGTNILLYNWGLQKNTLAGRADGGYVGPGVTEDGHPNAVKVPSQIYFQNISTGPNHVTEEFVYDASFIKLRSISLIYAVPESVLRKSFIKGLSVSLVARNIATLMKHTPNIDPESNLSGTNAQGLELSGYPAMRSMGVNVNVRF